MPDDEDECDGSNLGATVVIEECDSGVVNDLFDDGCTMADRIVECGGPGSRGFDDCVKRLTKDWVREGLITAQERKAIRECAGETHDDDDDGDHDDDDGHDNDDDDGDDDDNDHDHDDDDDNDADDDDGDREGKSSPAGRTGRGPRR